MLDITCNSGREPPESFPFTFSRFWAINHHSSHSKRGEHNLASEQAAILAPVPSEGGGNAVGQVSEAAPRGEMVRHTGAGRPSVMGVEASTATWFRGMLLRRRCDSCGTRIHILTEVDDRVFMKCPECLREYVFFHRPE